MNSTNDSQLDDDPPVNDPDHDFDEKNNDYLDFIISKLQSARTETQLAQKQATEILSGAKERERALWLSYESYLSGCARWREQKTGSGDIRKPSGALLWVEEEGGIEIENSAALQAWVQTQLLALLELAAALQISNTASPQYVPPKLLPDRWPEPIEREPAGHPEVTRVSISATPAPSCPTPPVVEPTHAQPTAEPVLAALRTFRQRTQLLPAGCRIGPPRHVLRLE